MVVHEVNASSSESFECCNSGRWHIRHRGLRRPELSKYCIAIRWIHGYLADGLPNDNGALYSSRCGSILDSIDLRDGWVRLLATQLSGKILGNDRFVGGSHVDANAALHARLCLLAGVTFSVLTLWVKHRCQMPINIADRIKIILRNRSQSHPVPWNRSRVSPSRVTPAPTESVLREEKPVIPASLGKYAYENPADCRHLAWLNYPPLAISSFDFRAVLQ